MKFLHVAAALTLLATPSAASAQSAAKSATELAWLSGSWVLEQGGQRTEEHWTSATANGLLGMGRSVRGERTVFFEYLRIEAREDGVFYVAQPLGRPPTEFKLVKLEGQSAVFENPTHDYPKRILYRRNADGSLAARVEGNGKSEDFAYRPMD